MFPVFPLSTLSLVSDPSLLSEFKTHVACLTTCHVLPLHCAACDPNVCIHSICESLNAHVLLSFLLFKLSVVRRRNAAEMHLVKHDPADLTAA